MERKTTLPTSREHWLELRKRNINSTESAALFGISPYITEFELSTRHRTGMFPEIETNERMDWGTALQDSIAHELARRHGLSVRRKDAYVEIPELRAGSSFDFEVEGGGLLEVKNVDARVFRDSWIAQGDSFEAPPAIELQVQHQLFVSGSPYVFIGVLVGGNEGHLIRREPDLAIHEALKARIRKFWKDLEAGVVPAPDFERDASFLSSLYSKVREGTLDASGDSELRAIVEEYAAANRLKSDAEAALKIARAKILERIKDAPKVIGQGFTISAGLRERKPYQVAGSQYRELRVKMEETCQLTQ